MIRSPLPVVIVMLVALLAACAIFFAFARQKPAEIISRTPSSSASHAALGSVGVQRAWEIPSASASFGAGSNQWPFSAGQGPSELHLQAQYSDAKGLHSLELYRQGQRRLRKITDNRLELHAQLGDDNEMNYVWIDRAKSLVQKVSRTNLYRIGSPFEFSSAATMLTKPHTDFSVAQASPDTPIETPMGACTLYRVELKGASQEICWSPTWGIPLFLRGNGFWLKVTSLDSTAHDADFVVDIKGMRVIDANEQIDPSLD